MDLGRGPTSVDDPLDGGGAEFVESQIDPRVRS
jgi:hypothetical protein